jgi:hypothetical protein
MKNSKVVLSFVPDGLAVVPFGSSFSVRCDLCNPQRTKAINWHPDKRPAEDRCADFLVGHLRSTHGFTVSTETAVDLVRRASPKKVLTTPAETPKSVPFSPYGARL